MTMRIYQSTDASAPTLQGVVGGAYSGGWADGSFLNLLEKCLVSGYGSKTAAGWSTAFNGTSKGVFRLGGGTRFYFRVLDDGSLTAGAREAQVYGGETASDVDTLTGQFPTSAQSATYVKFRKSNAASSTPRYWMVLADNATAIVLSWSNQGDGATDYLTAIYLGDFYSLHASDAYNCCVIGRTTSATLDAATNETLASVGAGANVFTAQSGHYLARGYAQLGGSVQFGIAGGFFTTATATIVSGTWTGLAFPNPTDSRILLSRAYVTDPTTTPASSLRGYLRGLWLPQHSGSVMPREYSFGGVGSLAGRTFKLPGLPAASSTSSAALVLETSDTWD